MKLQSALDLKRDLVALARERGIRIHTERALRTVAAGFSPGAAATAFKTPSVDAMAIGVAPHRSRKREFRIAIRVYGRGSALSGSVLESLPRLHDDELDLAYGVRYSPRAGGTLSAGGSCGHFRITAGTLGGFVEDKDEYYVLSNNHVLADSDAGTAGDPIYAPGPVDVRKGTKPRTVARLTRFARLSGKNKGKVDAAIGVLDDSLEDFHPWWYQGIGEMDPRAIRDRYAVENVVKRGRTTKVTKGVVSAFELDGVVIDYGTPGAPLLVTFDDQLEFVHVDSKRPFSQPGDSGSLILDRDSLRPFALLYGGGPDERGIDRTLAHFIPDVLAELGVDFVR